MDLRTCITVILITTGFLGLGSTQTLPTYHSFDSFNVITDPSFDYSVVNYLQFSVQACNDATIFLTDTFGQYSAHSYGFTIGGLGNQVVQVRDCWFCNITTQVPITGLANCDRSRNFWITWQNSSISLGQGSIRQMSPIISNYPVTPGYRISYVGLNTANGAVGTWILPQQGYMQLQTPASFVDMQIGGTGYMDNFMVFQTNTCGNYSVTLYQAPALIPNYNGYRIQFGVSGGNNIGVSPFMNGPLDQVFTAPGVVQCGVVTYLWIGWFQDTNTVQAGSGSAPFQNVLAEYTRPETIGLQPRMELLYITGTEASGVTSTTLPRSRYKVQYQTSADFITYDTGFFGGLSSSLVDVQACSDAVLLFGPERGLTKDSATPNTFYAFTLGAENNTMSMIERCSNGRCVQLANATTPNILSCDEALDFWFFWDVNTGDISFGSGFYTGLNPILFTNDVGFTNNNWMFGSINSGTQNGVWTFPREWFVKANTQFTTPLQYTTVGDMGVLAQQFFAFNVLAPSSAQVTLETVAPLPSNIFQGYQFILSDANNSTMLQRCSENVCSTVDTVSYPGLLEPEWGVNFWVSFANGNIQLGEGWTVGGNIILSYVDSTPFDLSSPVVRVASGQGGANFAFQNSGCYFQLDIGFNENRQTCVFQ